MLKLLLTCRHQSDQIIHWRAIYSPLDEKSPFIKHVMLGAITLLLSGCLTAPTISQRQLPTTPAQDINESHRLQKDAEQALNKSDFARAEALFKRVLAFQINTLGPEHIDTIRTIFYLGAALSAQGKNIESVALLKRSYSVELLSSINDGNTERAITLLEQGVNPNACNPRGLNALMYAGRAGQTQVIKVLLNKGADVNVRSSDGNTSLIESIKFGDPEAVKLLLLRGADVNSQDGKGETALRWAQKRFSEAPADRSLLSNLPERTQYGDLAFATKKEFQEIIGLLKNEGAKE